MTCLETLRRDLELRALSVQRAVDDAEYAKAMVALLNAQERLAHAERLCSSEHLADNLTLP